MSVLSSDHFVFGTYDHAYLMRLTESLLDAEGRGVGFHTLSIRTWLETTPVNCHHKFVGWLFEQTQDVVDVWLRLGNSGTCAPWVQRLYDDLVAKSREGSMYQLDKEVLELRLSQQTAVLLDAFVADINFSYLTAYEWVQDLSVDQQKYAAEWMSTQPEYVALLWVMLADHSGSSWLRRELGWRVTYVESA